MNNLNEMAFLGAVLFGISVFFLASSYNVYRRHAIPKSPLIFHLLTILPGVGVAVSSFLLAAAFLIGASEVAGIPVMSMAIVFAVCLLLREIAFNIYTLYNNARESGGTERQSADERRRKADEERVEVDKRRQEADDRRQEADDRREGRR